MLRSGRGCFWGWFYFMGVWVRTLALASVCSNLLGYLSRKRLFPVVCIGYMGNNVYPARAGEVLRSILLKQSDGRTNLGLVGNDRGGAPVRRHHHSGSGLVKFPAVRANRARCGVGKPYSDRFDPCCWYLWVTILIVFLAMLFLPKQTQSVSGWLINKLLPAKAPPESKRNTG